MSSQIYKLGLVTITSNPTSFCKKELRHARNSPSKIGHDRMMESSINSFKLLDTVYIFKLLIIKILYDLKNS